MDANSNSHNPHRIGIWVFMLSMSLVLVYAKYKRGLPGFWEGVGDIVLVVAGLMVMYAYIFRKPMIVGAGVPLPTDQLGLRTFFFLAGILFWSIALGPTLARLLRLSW